MKQVLSRLTPGHWRSRLQSVSAPSAASSHSLARASLPNQSPATPASQHSNGEAQHGLEDGAEAPQAVPLVEAAAAAAAGGLGPLGEAGVAAQVAAGHLPMSPFDMPAPLSMDSQRKSVGPPAGRHSPAGAVVPGDARLLLYQHSMIRLRSSLEYMTGQRSQPVVHVMATVQEGGTLPDALAGLEARDSVEPEHVLEEPQRGPSDTSSQAAGSLRLTGSPHTGGSWQNAAIRVASRWAGLLVATMSPDTCCLHLCLHFQKRSNWKSLCATSCDLFPGFATVGTTRCSPQAAAPAAANRWSRPSPRKQPPTSMLVRCDASAGILPGWSLAWHLFPHTDHSFSCRCLPRVSLCHTSSPYCFAAICRQAGCGRPGHSAGGATHQPLCRGGVRPAKCHLGQGEVRRWKLAGF